jgi:AcrR family transcriptional regulator
MNSEENKIVNGLSTEEKIKIAARTVFHKKGFAAARTRDIAEEAGINLALLNYYFRSKEKLFQIIMLDAFQSFFSSMSAVFNDAYTTLDEKIEKFAGNYIDLLLEEPDIPMFIMSEIRNDPEGLLEKIDLKSVIFNSVFLKQYLEAIQLGKIKDQHFLHFMLNFIGLLVFPFIAKPLLKGMTGLNETQYNELVADRKALIPDWMSAIMKN